MRSEKTYAGPARNTMANTPNASCNTHPPGFLLIPNPIRYSCNSPATPEIYTLSLHDALPICEFDLLVAHAGDFASEDQLRQGLVAVADRKSTRLNSSHSQSSYAVFCLKKKTRTRRTGRPGLVAGCACAAKRRTPDLPETPWRTPPTRAATPTRRASF